MDVDRIIEVLGLEPHPEGGLFREIYREFSASGERGTVTSIYFLLRENEVSRWHRVDATEIWNFHAGDPLELKILQDGIEETAVLGADLETGARPQIIVPPHVWQSARCLRAWTLVGCTVAPAFDFDGFELAPKGWSPEHL